MKMMRKMNKWFSAGVLLWLTVCCTGCDKSDERGERFPDVPEKPVMVVYENDVHCAVEGYAQMAAVKKEMQQQTPYVSTVSCGDFVQGGLVGSVSHGEYIVEVMNRVGYDVVTLGNHEFDYGMEQLFRLTESLEAAPVCCNFRDLRTGKSVYPSYKMLSYGRTDVAFIGIATTATPTSTSPLTYQDGAGNTVYDFAKSDFFPCVQQAIDEARSKGADYVVALSHLGELFNDDHATSFDLIAHTTGLDAVLDGHSHSIIPDTLISDAGGNPVLLSSTGTEFEYVGVLTIGTDGKLDSRLVPAAAIVPDPDVEAFVDDIKQKASEGGDRVIATNSVPFSITDEAGNRIARLRENTLGNLCADAFRCMLNTDVAMINGGGIRAGLPTGEITYNHLLSVFPFENTGCTATLTGSQLADALEVSVRLLPEENGSFMQVSGIRFEVDASVPTPVVLDDGDLFSHITDASRRVSNIYIRNKESGEYEPLDPEKVYTLASFDYQLKELGSEGIFRYATLKGDNLMTDVEVLATYIEQVLGGHIGNMYEKEEGRIKILP